MKPKINKASIIPGLLLLAVGLFLGWLFFHNNPGEAVNQSEHTMEDHLASGETTWTCSMHPQIRQSEPGSCPICGMDLIPVEQDNNEANPALLEMSETAMKLANIQTTTVGYSKPEKDILLNGIVKAAEGRIYNQTAHFPGRIENLYINFTGDQVKRGQKIASVYSPELLTAQEELFTALKYKETNPAILNAARNKLKLWKLTDSQINAIEESGKIRSTFDIRADISGIVMDKKVNIGDHVMAGGVLFELADLNNVWVVFDAYESDLPWISVGDKISFTIASIPGKTFGARVTFIDPVIDPKTRVASVRIEVQNTEGLLKPEMFAKGTITSRITQNPQTDEVTVPKSSVMWTGTRSVVYVKVPGQKPSFLMKEITLGPALGDSYVVKEGLEPGEKVVTNGTFTLDAAAQLQGKASMMNPEGGSPVTGHDHGQMSVKTSQASAGSKTEISEEFKNQLGKWVEDYLDLKDALINTEVDKAKKVAEQLQADLSGIDMKLLSGDNHNRWMENYKIMEQQSQKIAGAKTIDEQRKYFIALSDATIKSVKAFGTSQETLYLQHCPMANSDVGADWLSSNANVLNPYYGELMPNCGETIEVLK